MHRSADIAIVGAGIVGLAHAYMALKKGYRVVLFERNQFAIGASIRNFGLLWPIGQLPGTGLDRALRSRDVWMEICREAEIWCTPNGSLHLAYHEDEMDVLSEFQKAFGEDRYNCNLVTPEEILSLSPVVKRDGLKGGLHSKTECTVYAREAIRKIPLWLEEKFGLVTRFGHVVTEISDLTVKTAGEAWKVQHVIVCSGADFETLFPAVFRTQQIKKCKLQMMKVATKHPLKLGPSLCAGLTLRHYAAFGQCPSLHKVDARYNHENKKFKEHGVHVLLSQNNRGEFIVGDSHEYAHTFDPFDSEEINSIIIDYLKTFADLGDLTITERWHGIYPKLDGKIDLVVDPEPGVTIVNGLGGAGMTLSFGLAEEVINRIT